MIERQRTHEATETTTVHTHFAVGGVAACACHDVQADQLTTDAWLADCLRCARTQAWRTAAGLPEATTPSQAAAMSRYGRRVEFRALPCDAEDERNFELWVGRKVLWRKRAWAGLYGGMREAARAWATEHGFIWT